MKKVHEEITLKNIIKSDIPLFILLILLSLLCIPLIALILKYQLVSGIWGIVVSSIILVTIFSGFSIGMSKLLKALSKSTDSSIENELPEKRVNERKVKEFKTIGNGKCVIHKPTHIEFCPGMSEVLDIIDGDIKWRMERCNVTDKRLMKVLSGCKGGAKDKELIRINFCQFCGENIYTE